MLMASMVEGEGNDAKLGIGIFGNRINEARALWRVSSGNLSKPCQRFRHAEEAATSGYDGMSTP